MIAAYLELEKSSKSKTVSVYVCMCKKEDEKKQYYELCALHSRENNQKITVTAKDMKSEHFSSFVSFLRLL